MNVDQLPREPSRSEWMQADIATSLYHRRTFSERADPSVAKPEYQIRAGPLFILGRGKPPQWLPPTAQALGRLLDLRPDWDSYGASPIDPDIVVGAVYLLDSIMCRDSPGPSVVPTNSGGVQIEWHTKGIDLEIELLSPQRFHVSFHDSVRSTEWERELVSDLTPLVSSIDQLSRA
jgi:hypothetical protein